MTTPVQRLIARGLQLGCASGLAFVALAGLDALTSTPNEPLTWLAGLGLGALCGLVAGWAWALVTTLLSLLPLGVARALWVVPCAGWAYGFASRVGGFDKLGSRHGAEAAVVLGGAALAGAWLAALAALIQPARDGNAALAPIARRTWLAVALASGVLVASAADRLLYPGLYPPLHTALREIGLVQAVVLVALFVPGFSGRTLLALVAASALPFALLDERTPARNASLLEAPYTATCLTAARQMLDMDADGLPLGLGGGDCAPFDPAVHPGAREQLRNGVDDNCRLGDATHTAPPAGPVARQPHATGPSLVLITVDAVRADHVGSYGYARPTTPRIDAFFAPGRAYDHVYAAGSYTSISVPSLMRGVYPRRIRWGAALETNRMRLLPIPLITPLEPGERPSYVFAVPLQDPTPTLAARLAALGVQTAAVVDDGLGQHLTLAGDEAGGFASYASVPAGMNDPDEDRRTADLAIAQLESLAASGAPYFLWTHFFGPHYPSTRKPGAPWFGDSVIDAYDHELAVADLHVGRLLDAIAKLTSTPVVLLTSDHGELFHASARSHGTNLAEGEVRVPLLLRGPGVPNGRDPRLASLLDVLPTLLALAKAPLPANLDGRDLLAPAQPNRVVLSDVWRFNGDGSLAFDRTAAMDGRLRMVREPATNGVRLYASADGDRATTLADTPGAEALTRAIDLYLEGTGGPIVFAGLPGAH